MTKKHDIIWLDVTDSTNDEAARRISDLDNLSVLSAASQTSGRGQRTNIWISEPGKNLTFTIVLKYRHPGSTDDGTLLPTFEAKDQKMISDITAASVISFLRKHGITGTVKQPNDILADGRKICGILIEHTVRGMYLTHSRVGIGLNVNQTHFDPSIPNPTSMALQLEEKDPVHNSRLDLNTCLEDFMDIFTHALLQRLQPDSQP